MSLPLPLQGLLIGFSIAAPVGPIGLLCIQLTLTNPLTILAFTAIFAGLGLAATERSFGQALVLVLTVFTGSALWWLLLSGGVTLLRGRFRPQHLQWINWGSGAIILGFGLIALVSWVQTAVAS